MDVLPHVLLLALCAVPGVSWSLIAREARRTLDLESLLAGVFTEDSEEARNAALLIAQARADFSSYVARAEAEIAAAFEGHARLTTVLDERYPANLREIFNLPPFLFHRGILLRDDARAVAVVGTREASPEGLARAANMAKGLVDHGVTVISGLARGIDTAAHRATLEAGGRTIAVVGTGILRCYPPENETLAEEIADKGATVSQFWPSASPAQWSFPRRNVVMSGMGQGTVVIEATRKSGAKMQARLALQHGKKVFLVRSLVTDQPWARDYLRRGAIEVSSVEDVVAALESPDAIEQRADGRRQLALEGL